MPKRPLSAIAAGGPRRGALLRTGGGFAGIHPWPELGDAPLDEQLVLARGETTSLTRASLRFASIDAAARREGRSLFEGLTIPPSHWPGPDPPDGFDTVKLKSIDRIPDRVRLRIDFNATLTPDDFLRIAATLPGERIDFIEDPCPYDAAIWRDLRSRTGLRLALDRAGGEKQRYETPNAGRLQNELRNDPILNIESPSPPRAGEKPKADEGASCREKPSGSYDVLVIKPSLQENPATDKEIIVTSYMDHPIGQLCAAYAAATVDITATCGLITHVLYKTDAFIERMQIDKTSLVPPGGTGLGFDDLLENLPWQRL